MTVCEQKALNYCNIAWWKRNTLLSNWMNLTVDLTLLLINAFCLHISDNWVEKGLSLTPAIRNSGTDLTYINMDWLEEEIHGIIRVNLKCLQVWTSTNLKSNYDTFDWWIDSVGVDTAPQPYSSAKSPGSNPGNDKKCKLFFIQWRIWIFQQLLLLTKSLFVSNNCKRKKYIFM